MLKIQESVLNLVRDTDKLGAPRVEARLGGSQGNSAALEFSKGANPPGYAQTIVFSVEALSLRSAGTQALLKGVLRSPAPADVSGQKYSDHSVDLRKALHLFDGKGSPISMPKLDMPQSAWGNPRLSQIHLMVTSGAQNGLHLAPPVAVYKDYCDSYGGIVVARGISGVVNRTHCNLDVSTGVEGTSRGIKVVDCSLPQLRTIFKAWTVAGYHL